jgi:hypothetical protein
MNQEQIEILYSQRNNNTVLHATIDYELDKSLLNWALFAHLKIHFWLHATHKYASKQKRVDQLLAQVTKNGLDTVVIAIAAAVLHTHTKQTIQQAVGYLQAYMPHSDSFHRAITAGELLALCASSTGLYDIQRNGSGNNTLIKINHWDRIDAKLLNAFDWINDTCFNPPMVEPPKEITDSSNCGFHTIKEPFILGKLTQHDGKQNYRPNNILNKIQWVLDPDVLAEPEVPSKPLDTPEQHIQFTAMAVASRFIYKLLDKIHFYIPWQDDSRGRLYSHGYHVNFQAAEYKKASLSFNRYEELT